MGGVAGFGALTGISPKCKAKPNGERCTDTHWGCLTGAPYWRMVRREVKDQPWIALGMSRATWCRYGKPDKPGKPSPKLRGAVSEEEQEERRKRLTYAVQLVCKKYKNKKLIFSSQ